MKLRQLTFQTFYYLIITFAFVSCATLLIYGITKSSAQDFGVFYNSANAALHGESIYITSGESQLPFLSPPWGAWFYIFFAIFPKEFALILYAVVSVLSIIMVINILTRYYTPDFKFLDKALIFSLIIPMNFLLIIVGQMDYILLGIAVIIIYAIEQKKDVLAGILFPLLWIKPHLFIIFTLFAFWRAGKRALLVSLALPAFMLLLETIIRPGWQFEMLNILRSTAQRSDYKWNVTTLPNLLGSQENWLGTANLPFTILLIISAILILWKFRTLPTIPLLSMAMAASLVCAPRAYAYDLPLLIPAMLWLTTKDFKSNIWLWIAGALIPFWAEFSSGSYLLTLLVFFLCVFKAYNTLSKPQVAPVTV